MVDNTISSGLPDLIYITFNVIGFIGNFMVIWIVLAHKKMRTVNNLFLVNLAIAEGLSTLLFPIRAVLENTVQRGSGWLVCKIIFSGFYVTMFASIFTLSAIAVERYIVIVHPLKKRLTGITTLMAVVGIWIFSLILSIPHITVVKLIETSNEIVCKPIWPSEHLRSGYVLSILIVFIVLPFSCMVHSYARIGAVLWTSKLAGEQNETQIAKQRDRKTVVKMLITVTIVFIIFCLPFRLFVILEDILATWNLTTESWFWDDFISLAIFLNNAHPVCNPIIYYWISEQFRTEFKWVFKCSPCRNVPN